MKPQNACHVQYPIKMLVDSCSDDGSEPFLKDSFLDFAADSVMESVSSLPANEKYYSVFTLMDLNGSAVSTMITNFSK